ncbi:MAG TPA: uroporphyrinogen-III C-methyltransferase [Xanthomonadales bacterium]|nr:uroporphyrinogen-III C-methyltransferase [Xanthomonadales bacterium]
MNADEMEARPEKVLPLEPGEKFPDEAPPARAGGGRASGLSLLSLLLAGIALVIAAWMWWQGEQSRSQQLSAWQAQQQHYQDELKRLEDMLAAAQDSSSRQSSELSSGLQQRVQALEAMRNEGEDFRSETSAWSRSAQAALEDSQARLNSMDEKLRNLAARSAESDTELELEEIEYLLRMAQERLELFGDTRNADRALQLADQQVQAFDNPMFIGLRREIAAARQALTAADVPDMVIIGSEIDGLQDRLALLPFRSGLQQTEPDASVDGTPAEQHWWERLKATLSGLVTVRRVDDAELAMPVLADQLALRQRAWLQVEQARLAALGREQAIYQESLAQAEATVQRWFAADDPQVKLVISGLQSLQQRNVDPPMPDISAPWVTLRSIREGGLTTVPQAVEPAAGPVSSPATNTVDEVEEPALVTPDNSTEELPGEAAPGDHAADEADEDGANQPAPGPELEDAR